MIKWIWPFLIIFLLSSCTSIAPSTNVATAASDQTPPSWASRQSALLGVHNWQLNGKVAFRSAREAGSASLNWTQNNQAYTIDLLGPLGTNGVRLSGRPGQVVMQMANGQRYSASNPEQLLAEKAGWHLPVSNLFYWIRGLPVPNLPATKKFDQQGHLVELLQQGWRIKFLSYSQQGKLVLPTKMELSSRQLTVKMMVYRFIAH